MLGKGFGERMRASFLEDLAASKQVTLERWQQRSPADRVKEMFARLWQYWL